MSAGSQSANNINPSMLVWARETAGFSKELVAERVGLSTSRLAAIESGTTFPTRLQLAHLAIAYSRPPTIFYLASPPAPGPRGVDFRATPYAEMNSQDSTMLDACLRDIRVRHSILRAALEDDEHHDRPKLYGLFTLEDGVLNAAASIRRALKVPNHWVYSTDTGGGTFDWLRSRIEDLGAFVLLAGDVVLHRSAVSERVFRGFAIADEVAPLIAINYQDEVIARPFTLLHEFVHICLGTTGVSAAPPSDQPMRVQDHIEFFCNDVASEFLLPSDDFATPSQMWTSDAARKWIKPVAQEWHVSESMVAYRLWRNERITSECYRRLHAFYADRWQNERRRKGAKMREIVGHPNRYAVRQHRLGEALLSQTHRLLQTEEITHAKAARILGVTLDSVGPLLSWTDE